MPLRAKLIATFLIALTTSAAIAQPVPMNALAGKDAAQGVYVRDSAIAVEKLALAERMERLKEWEKSADVYQEVIDKYSDRIVPSQLDKNQTIYQYASVITIVQKRLAKWPAEGLQVYLHKFEPAAATMLESASADDLEILNRVASQYFVTDSGKAAAQRLIDLYLESGEFAAAAWMGEQLLESHPNIRPERAKLLYRTALAHHLSGDDKSAQTKLDELKQKEPDAAGMIRGAEIKLVDSLEQELKLAPPTARSASADSWPMLRGSPDRARVPEAHGRPGAKLFEVPVSQSNRPVARDPTLKQQFISTVKSSKDAGLMLGIMPVVDQGELFFQDNARIYAVRLESNVPLPGWQTTYGDHHGQYVTDNATSMPRSVQLDVALTDNSVVAILGQLDRLALANQAAPQNRESKLVCLDRQSGKEKWTVTPRKLPDSVANLRSAEFGGAPLIVGENVYIGARGGKPMQFEDAYVLCFCLNDGKFRWACYIASGSVPGEVFEGMMATSENVSQLAYASGRLYVLTNLGAAAAIDAYRGTIVWLNIYPRPGQNFPRRFDLPNMSTFGQKPWAFNPPIVKDGKVFVLPADANHLLVYDAGSGIELQRIHLSDFENADTIVGVAGDKLLLSGDNRLWCVNWPAYDVKKAADGNLFWSSNQERRDNRPGRSGPRDTWIRGHGFLTSDSVFLPSKTGLLRIELNSGRVAERYPSNGDWNPREEEPGNVLVTQDHVIIAGVDRVSVYTDMTLARAKLDREVAAAPTSAEPRLRYAEMMFVSGDYDLTVAKLDEAIGLVGGAEAMKRGADRDRIFSDALVFAQKLADPNGPTKGVTPENMPRAEAMFQRAGAAADSAAQQVQYRLARVGFARSTRDFSAEVRLCQEILSDPAMRAVSITGDGNTMPQLAGAWAENKIDEDLQNFPAIYKEFDQLAATALNQAQSTNDPAALLKVAQTYPNSTIAPEAMLAAADCYEEAGNPRTATQVLNQAYRRYADRNEDVKARIVEAQARNYLALPNGLGIAIGRLADGAKMRTNPSLQQPLKLPDGTTLKDVTFAAALEQLRKYSAGIVTRSLPDFHIPIPPEGRPPINPFLPDSPETVIPDVDALLVPLRDFSRNDRLVTWTANKGTGIYAVGTTKALGTSAVLPDQPLGAAWMGDRLLIYSATKIALLQGENGTVVWEATLKNLPRADLVDSGGEAPPDEPAPMPVPVPARAFRRRVIRLNNQQVVIVNNQVVVRGVRNPGVGIFQNPRPPRQPGDAEAIEHVRPAGDHVIVGTSTGRIFALETAGGKIAWQTRLTESPLEQLLANDDFVAVRLTDDQGPQIVALDTFAGQVVYRRAFPAADPMIPVNMVMSPDGQLVYTLPDRLCIKDLFQAGGDLVEWPDHPDGQPLYAGASREEQLVISDGRVLALSDGGQFVRVHSLQTGHPITNRLATGSQQNNFYVALRVVGSHLYIVNQKTVMGYNLDVPEDAWPGMVLGNPDPEIHDAFIGNNFVVLLDQPGHRAPRAPTASCRLLIYGVYPDAKGVQTGRLDYPTWIRDPHTITEWQAVEGGFYYRSGDRKLHFLRGIEQAK